MTSKPELSDFLVDVERHSFFPAETIKTKEYDWGKIMALPDEDFARVHYLFMRQYKDGDGWWSHGNINCESCKKEIPGPVELVRHSSKAYHLKCFKEMYNKTKAEFIKRLARDPKVHTIKWDRISNLDPLEEKVEYVALYNHEKFGEKSRWYKSIEEFNRPKIIDDKEVPRFKRIK